MQIRYEIVQTRRNTCVVVDYPQINDYLWHFDINACPKLTAVIRTKAYTWKDVLVNKPDLFSKPGFDFEDDEEKFILAVWEELKGKV